MVAKHMKMFKFLLLDSGPVAQNVIDYGSLEGPLKSQKVL